MTLRRAVALAMVAAFAALTVATAATARPPSPPSTLDPDAFQPVELADSAAGNPEPLPSIDYGAPASPVRIGDFHDDAPPVAPRPKPRQPVRAESVPKATPRPKLTHGVSGTASWYCKAGVSACHNAYPSGLYAAAGPALRVGDWRGRTVTVCGSGSCVNVKLIDWCACGSGRVIDLYSDAFSRLAPLSSGTLSVRVSW